MHPKSTTHWSWRIYVTWPWPLVQCHLVKLKYSFCD